MAKKIKKLSKKFIALICMFTLVFSYSVVGVNESDAAGVAATLISDTLSDSRPTELADHVIKFVYAAGTTLVAGDKQKITFTGFTAGAVTTNANWAVAYSTDSGVTYTTLTETTHYTLTQFTATASPFVEIVWVTAGKDLVNTNKYVRVTFTNGASILPNPSAGTYSINLTGTGNWATGTAQVATLSGVAVSATIDQYMTFVSSAYVAYFGSWSAGSTAIRYANSTSGTETPTPGAGDPFALTLTSNVAGASISIKSVNAALYNASDTVGADFANNITAGNEGYAVFGVATQNITMVTGANGFNGASSTGTMTTANQPFADTSTVGEAIIEVDAKAAISTATLPGSYTDTLVFVATPVY